MINENIVNLISKCLNLAGSPNENEAAAAMAKAQELLLKYNLDMADIKSTNPGAPADDESILINENVNFDNYQDWRWTLLNVIAITNFCKTIRTSGGVRILGRKANVRVVAAMYNWLEPQIIRLAVKSGFKRADKTTYISGIINTIHTRMNDQMKAAQVNVQTNALIVNLKTETDGYFRSFYPHTTSARSHSSGSSAAYSQGRADGAGVAFGNSRQVTGRLLLN